MNPFLSSIKLLIIGIVLIFSVNTFSKTLLFENFETWPPSGWTIANDSTGECIWASTASSSAIYNNTGGTGEAAAIQATFCSSIYVDTSLISPALDFSSSDPRLKFKTYFNEQSFKIFRKF